MEKSQKRYGVAVCLIGLFGLLGIHHFYLGRWLHGLADLAMTATATYLLVTGQELLGWGVLAVDGIHTLIVMIMLLVGAYRDGLGRIVAHPGQPLTSH
ncbi:hypothetical protein [Halomonas cupida]|uniref:TM2 domain-containing protein n=1 Tax=Halomonas cupida TaxID=44933 RepID=A0A1M7MMK0_9GAMM|nr:hypothetical protein [Halomonas cupida]GEN26106.1 hypothetical protein HCU01_40550 [Halomonas cupida]SHM92106.1 hypothetical protein SAMN05660971_04275 [Halomonas cupida]